MPRYIDAYFAQQIADAELGSSDKGTVQWILAHTPTADVQEVKHGNWVKVSEHMPIYNCSICLNRNLFKNGNNVFSNFCPHCGAKMEGGER